MRLSELLDCQVVDEQGERVGRVHDVRLVQDGPLAGGFGASLRVAGLIVGRGAVGTRLGYDRPGMRGPWLVRAVAGHHGRYVAWELVLEVEPNRRIRIRGRGADLPGVAPASGAGAPA